MANQADGIFTQPGPDGIFGRGGDPQNPEAASVDGDGTMLRETLVAAFPSPGHMRVARAVRHPQSGKVEFQEEYRIPTPEEVELLRRQGVIDVGPGSMIRQPGQSVSGLGEDAPAQPAESGTPWLKIALAAVGGAAAFWAANKWVVPLVTGGGDGDGAGEDGGEEVEDEADDEVAA